MVTSATFLGDFWWIAYQVVLTVSTNRVIVLIMEVGKCYRSVGIVVRVLVT
jgi:hypothetical protein